MRLPTIHLNGTARDALLNDVATAEQAVRVAIRALIDAAPNGRDYYPQGPEAFLEAVQAHAALKVKLEEVADVLFDLADGIAGGGFKGERR